MTGSKDGCVEVPVLGDRVVPACPRDELECGFDLVVLGLGVTLRREPRGQRIEFFSYLVEGHELIWVERCHDNEPMRKAADQPFALEPTDRLAQWSCTHTQFLRD